MLRNFAVAVVLCLVAATVLAQNRISGKWETDRPQSPPLTEAQRKQAVQMDMTIVGDKASGTLNLGGLGGTLYTFQDGKATNGKVQFRAAEITNSPTWTVELVADNTVMLSRGSLPITVLPLVGNNVLDLIKVLSTQTSPQASQQPIGRAAIFGIVQDKSKALIPGVRVTARDIDTGTEFMATTDGTGVYGITNLPPGKYTMTAALPGFQTAILRDINVGDSQLGQDFTMEIGPASAPTNPTPATCSRDGITWCVLMHRVN